MTQKWSVEKAQQSKQGVYMVHLTIEALSERTGVDVDTIRHFEQTGLIKSPIGSDGVNQVYDELAVKRIDFITHWTDLGTPLEDIRQLMKLVRELNESPEQMEQIKQAMLREAKNQQSALQELREELKSRTRM